MSIETVSQSALSMKNDITDFLDNAASTIVRPKSSKGISGFVFNVPDTESVTLTSEITDHYTESNDYINDHEIRKPITMTLTGFIGELTYTAPEGVEGALQEIDNRLETVDAYLGDQTPGFVQSAQAAVSQAQSVVSDVNQTLDRLQNVVDFFDGEGVEETEQQKAFKNFYAMWKSSMLLTVQTPWRFFDNMRITSVSFKQNADSEQITDISVSLKELRFAKTTTTSFDNYSSVPRVDIQSAESEDIGKVKGTSESFLYSASEAIQ